MPQLDLLFDLDHTLWDFVANSREALEELFVTYRLKELGIETAATFIHHYEVENERCWSLHRQGKMPREVLRIERFDAALRHFGVQHPELASTLAEAYVAISPSKTRLMPGSIEVLTHFQEQGHRLHILTNGFREVQHRKLEGSQLKSFFHGIFTSEELGYGKPHKEAFLRSLQLAKATVHRTWMIGDNMEADVRGAAAIGLQTVHYAPQGSEENAPHHRIRHLEELKNIIS